jgi:hypothetical protein
MRHGTGSFENLVTGIKILSSRTDPSSALTTQITEAREWMRVEEHVSESSRPIRIAPTRRITLIVGGVLTGVSVFLPWFHLSTPSPSDGPPEIDVNPWAVIHLDAGVPLLALAFAFLLLALGIVVSSVLLAFSRSARVRSALIPLVLILVFLCLGGVFLAYNTATTGLTLTSNYYATVQHGLVLFIAGCLITALGALMLRGARGPRGDVWPTNVA